MIAAFVTTHHSKYKPTNTYSFESVENRDYLNAWKVSLRTGFRNHLASRKIGLGLLFADLTGQYVKTGQDEE
jgi:hypothetical protein